MKVILVFMVLLALGMSLIPCCAPEMGDNKNIEVTSSCCSSCETNQGSDNSSNDNACKSCSPFFTCGSCTGFTILMLSYSLQQFDRINSENSIAYQLHFDSEYNNSLFQPPRI